MSTLNCAEVRELAPEMALGIVGGPQRADALQHASECGPCRALVGELAEAADALPLLAAEAEPPPGFEERVLSALKAPRRRSRRRVAAGLAIAAAAAAIVSIVGVRIVESTQETGTSRTAATGVRSSEMLGASGIHVGKAFVTDGDPATVFMNVSYGIPSGTYSIEYRADSVKKRLGDMNIRDGQGAWAGVARLPNQGSGSIALVDAAGTVVCEGQVARVT
jgi:hypothetical protein